MPLEILAILVVLGIGGIVLLLHLTGHTENGEIGSAMQAAAQWGRHFPDLSARDPLLSDDGRVALVATDRGAGVLWSIGADTTARLATGFNVQETDSGLHLRTGDFAAPHIHAPLADPAHRRQWMHRLKEGTT